MRVNKKYWVLMFSLGITTLVTVVSMVMSRALVGPEIFASTAWVTFTISTTLGFSVSYLVGYKVREVQRLSAELQRLVNKDTVTGALTRRRFLEIADKGRFEGVLIMVDIDHFKSVNDRFGHWIGDEALRHVAHTLCSARGDRGMVCRYGGDEFVLALPRLTREDAVPVLEGVRERMRKMGFVAEGREVPLTLSFGITETHSAEPVDAALRRADRALYAAKSGGRDRVA